jgi:hypothetical protein
MKSAAKWAFHLSSSAGVFCNMLRQISTGLLYCAVGIAFNAAPHPAAAFELDAHRSLNETALRASSLDSFLRNQVGLVDGAGTSFRHWQEVRTASGFVREGGAREDELGITVVAPPYWRVNRHFHDPLRPWASAGLKGLFDSSVVWMQEDSDSLGKVQGYSWPEARYYYVTALTASLPVVREEYWANTFQSIGQIMHLVEDAAQPAHVRNDAHAMEAICQLFKTSCYPNFEYWVKDHPSALPASGAGGIDPNLLQQETHHPGQPVPVARLIDTDTYDGFSVLSDSSIGLAEFTNANFFSEDTISNDVYLFPSLAPSALVPLPLLPQKRLPAESGHRDHRFRPS